MKKFVESLGVITTPCTVWVGEEPNDGFFIRNEDANKAQQQKIITHASLLGIEIGVSDKGATFC